METWHEFFCRIAKEPFCFTKKRKFLPLSFHDTILLSHTYKRTKNRTLGVHIPWIQFHKHGKKGKPMKRFNTVWEKITMLSKTFWVKLPTKGNVGFRKWRSSYQFHFMIQYCFPMCTKERKNRTLGLIYRGFSFTNMEKKGKPMKVAVAGIEQMW